MLGKAANYYLLKCYSYLSRCTSGFYLSGTPKTSVYMSLSYQFPSGLWCGDAFVLVLGFEELGVLDSKHLLRPQNALLYRK